MGQWFLTELIRYIAQYVSVLSLHREEEVENIFKQHIIYAKLSSEHRFRPINVAHAEPCEPAWIWLGVNKHKFSAKLVIVYCITS